MLIIICTVVLFQVVWVIRNSVTGAKKCCAVHVTQNTTHHTTEGYNIPHVWWTLIVRFRSCCSKAWERSRVAFPRRASAFRVWWLHTLKSNCVWDVTFLEIQKHVSRYVSNCCRCLPAAVRVFLKTAFLQTHAVPRLRQAANDNSTSTTGVVILLQSPEWGQSSAALMLCGLLWSFSGCIHTWSSANSRSEWSPAD